MRLTPFRTAVSAAVLFALGLACAPLIAQDKAAAPSATTAPRTPDEIYSDLSLFGEVFDRIRAEYVEAPDEKKLIHAALQGMLTSLDPHSGYMEPVDYAGVQEDTSGQFGGLGIEVQMEEGAIKVVSPIDDTPAAKAGILAGDFIVELDGTQVQGMTLDQAVEKMRGQVGTKIKLTVVREGVNKPLDFELTRDIIATRAARLTMDGDVAIIRLARFSEQAYVGIQKTIDDAYKQRNGKAPKGIVLDLRNNPGGLVDQAVLVSDAFLHQGAVVLTRGRVESESARYDAKPDALDEKLAKVPVVVLINGGSASAAEIVAGALQDHKRATLVGTRSFGKGSVQSIIPLGAEGAMRLTTARYYTPNNRSIQAAGIQPDIVITQDVPEEFKGRDEIIGEAALPGQIGGGTEEKATVGSSVYVPAEADKDNQLQYALKLINGQETNPAYPAQDRQGRRLTLRYRFSIDIRRRGGDSPPRSILAGFRRDMSELGAPLSRRKTRQSHQAKATPGPSLHRRRVPFARLALGLLVLIGAAVGLRLLLVDDPQGGRPTATVEISTSRDINPVAGANSTALPATITADPEPVAHAATLSEPPALDPTAILPDLVEETEFGQIPRMSPTGERPFEAYARAAQTPDAAGGTPLVAIVVSGLGLNLDGTLEAVRKLPEEVTLAFAPYGKTLDRTVGAARGDGHEIFLEVPLEPFDYPENDPGPDTLLTGQPPRDNMSKLFRVMSRFGGYAGIINNMGARFTASGADFGPLMEELGARGLGYLDDGSSNRSLAPQLAPRQPGAVRPRRRGDRCQPVARRHPRAARRRSSRRRAAPARPSASSPPSPSRSRPSPSGPAASPTGASGSSPPAP